MTHFTTSKGEFIAVPVPNDAKDFVLNQANKHSGIEYTSMGIFKVQTWLKDYPGVDFEIIGLSSDILKDEELAKKVVAYNKSLSKCFENPCESFKSVLLYHNVTGNQLIIKKK